MLRILQTKLLFIILSSLTFSCSVLKTIPSGKKFLKEEKYFINGEIIKNDPVKLLSSTPPNSKFMGIPIKVFLNNLVVKNPDILFENWLNENTKRKKRLNKIFSSKQIQQIKKYKIKVNEWLSKNSEKPILIEKNEINETANRINQYFKNIGYFENIVEVSIDPFDEKKSNVSYKITTGKQFILDSISFKTESSDIQKIYKKNLSKSLLDNKSPFKVENFNLERERLVNLFRNNGIFNFQQSSIRFKVFIDSIGIDTRIPVIIEVSNLNKRINDSLFSQPYSINKIGNVNIYVDDPNFSLTKFTDSISLNNVNIFSKGNLNYKPESLVNALSLSTGDIYKENERANTFRYFTELKNFKYPSINFKQNSLDSLKLDASIRLTPMERYSLGFDLDLSHSNIEDFGVSLGSSIITRNIFKGAEILELNIKGTIGSSRNVANPNSYFFNLFEIGTDLRLRIPRILFPINLNSTITRSMLPRTNITLGTSLQENVGLDRQNFSSNIEYEWSPNSSYDLNFKLLDLEFIKNRATNNYFNVYRNSYDRLNSIAKNNNYSNEKFLNQNGSLIIPEGTNDFIESVINNKTNINLGTESFSDIMAIKERKERLISDNFILGSSLSIIKNNQESILDEDFSQFNFKIEWVGNLINSILSINNKKEGYNEFLGVLPSQFIKTELNYIKHWKIGNEKVLAFRGFSGIAIPYGNSNSIPFTRSYFGGGSNDNRAWRVYKLGPGISQNSNEFNEANFKIAFNLEYRVPIIGAFKGALFIDAGNIWNVYDNITDPKMRFDGLKDLKEIAIGTGFGIRYDFNFFIFRLDTGFKTYDPVLPSNKRWWSQTSFKKAVFNIGINYPF